MVDIKSMDYITLTTELEEEGYPWKLVDETTEAVAREYGLLDEHGQYTRDFNIMLVQEVVSRLGPVPRPANRPPIGPPLTTRMPEDEIASLRQLAAQAGLTKKGALSEYVRRVLRSHLGEYSCPDCGRFTGSADTACQECEASTSAMEPPSGGPLGILNFASITADGRYSARTIDLEEAQRMAQSAVEVDTAVGHAPTAALLTEVLGVNVPSTPGKRFTQQVDQEVLAFQLLGRPKPGVELDRDGLERVGYRFLVITRNA